MMMSWIAFLIKMMKNFDLYSILEKGIIFSIFLSKINDLEAETYNSSFFHFLLLSFIFC